MSKIVKVKIKNFRGISELEFELDSNRNLICIIGRGDSGKSTVLEAISLALAPRWNISIHDTDYNNCDPSNIIEIEVTLIDFPKSFLHHDKYGLALRAYDHSKNSVVEVQDADNENSEQAITIRLTISSDNEPSWNVINVNSEKKIGWKDRAEINCFLISDYIDNQFTWSQGLPLIKAKNLHSNKDPVDTGAILDALRDARKTLEVSGFPELLETTQQVIKKSKEIGLNVSELKTSLDLKELARRDDRLTLHDDLIPLRLKGKGSKRMLSIAIQSLLVNEGGILLVDEIEQGLEPDRVKYLSSYLNNSENGQVFITSHSRDVIQEIGNSPLLLLSRNLTGKIVKKPLANDDDELLKLVRSCPEAFYSRKIILCEGRTEVGICRSIENFILENDGPPLSFFDCSIIDAEGSNQVKRLENLKGLFKICWFCDSDVEADNLAKKEFSDSEIKIIDCDNGLNIEQQMIKDMPWGGIKEILNQARNKNIDRFNNIFPEYSKTLIENIEENDNERLKIITSIKSLVSTKKKKENQDPTTPFNFFKDIYGGEFLGELVFKYWNKMDDKCITRTNFDNIIEWIKK
jgi:putative ATP-dependent endonuclease of OLD family